MLFTHTRYLLMVLGLAVLAAIPISAFAAEEKPEDVTGVTYNHATQIRSDFGPATRSTTDAVGRDNDRVFDSGTHIPDLVSSEELSKVNLETFVDLAFNEKITVDQTRAFYERLSSEQKNQVSSLVAIEAGISPKDWIQEVERHQIEPANSALSLRQGTLPLWREFVENTWTWGHPDGSTYASYYYTSRYCEGGDNPDPDIDYAFYYSMSYSRNPEGLRWTSDSSQVYLAFIAAYGGNINSYAYSWSEVRLCIGTTGVAAAGGADKVKNNVFLHPNN